MAGEADFGFAVAVEVQDRSVVQRHVANFTQARFIAINAAKRAHGDDGGKDEKQNRNGGGNHDVARQAALLLLADDLRQRREGDVGGGTFEALGGVPGGFGACEGYGMARVALDPVTNFGFFLRCRVTIELS